MASDTGATRPDGGAAEAAGVTSTGLPERVAATLAYALWWASGALMLALEPRNAYVRFHARQALVGYGRIWLLAVLLWAGSFAAVFVSPLTFHAAARVAQATWAVAIGLWAVSLVLAARGRRWRVPLVGPSDNEARGAAPAPHGDM